MRSAARAAPADRATLAVVGLLVLSTAAAWVVVVRDAGMRMTAPAGASVAEGIGYTLMWGVMMVAMMLPSALPMILLHRTVSVRLSGDRGPLAPVLFAAVYLAVWLLVGMPVYLLSEAVEGAAARWPTLQSRLPWAVAAALAAAGAYQLSPLKRACLRQCEAPLGFLMERWREGRAAAAALALEHAAYCLGCCWALMAILVAAGAMSLPWVLSISLLVLAEKVLPGGQLTARVSGWLLLLLALAVALRPGLATALRFSAPAPMPGMTM